MGGTLCKFLIFKLTKYAMENLLSEKELDNFLGKDEHAIKCEVSLFLPLFSLRSIIFREYCHKMCEFLELKLSQCLSFIILPES